jgi:hypothetical protein
MSFLLQEGGNPTGGQHRFLILEAEVQLLPLQANHRHPPHQTQRDARHLYQATVN